MRSRHLVAALVFSAACAAKGPPPQMVAEVARADALFRAGCYTCPRRIAGAATAMTYLLDGKQYIAITVQGRTSTDIPELIALP